MQKLIKHTSNIFILAIGFFSIVFNLMAYEVRFQGITDPKALALVQSVSLLEKLKNNPPSSITSLKRRAKSDLTTIVQALHSLAYYNAKVDFTIENEASLVIVKVQMGTSYPLADFQIHYIQNGKSRTPHIPCPFTLEDLHIQLGAPAYPKTILNAEDTLLDLLHLQGYAFATIRKRDTLADQKSKTITVILEVETGPLTYFGPTKISGLDRVRECFIYRKLRWRPGDLYDPKKIEKTQEALELSGLFRSVNVTHKEEPTAGDQQLPMEINVIEAKQRSLGFGLNYTTELGPGVTAEWEDRNILGEGQKLSLRADIWQRLQEASLSYLIPDFYCQDQNLIWLLDYRHEKVEAFTESAFTLSGIIERQLNERLRISYGGMYKLLHSKDSDYNGTFDLIKVPLQLRWSNADSLLDPTRGCTINVKITPSLQFLKPQFAYSINTFTGTVYQSLSPDHRHIFAAKLMLGSIVGANKHDIPPPERFYAGSENTLRGYKYLTVSPLDEDHKPIGGRSLFIYSLELRNRIGKNFGWVAFYEMGNVFSDSFPNFNRSLLQSVGLGLRYHTPVGPLRLDFAVPLNRRHHIDKPFQIYFSIGQSF